MKTSKPAVQNLGELRRKGWTLPFAEEKRRANRRHRRALSQTVHDMQRDPESFDAEPFEAPTFTTWDLV